MPVERTKTFTGCWTCRERRLKCDEVQPTCGRCASKGLACAGYNSRLHWLKPVSSSSSASSDDHRTTQKGLQRRRLLPANHIQKLSDDQIELLLSKINEEGTSSQHRVHGPFTVFGLQPSSTNVTAQVDDVLQADSSPLPTLMGEDQGDQVPQSLPPPPALLKDLPASSETALSVNPRVLDPGLTSSTDQDVTPYGPSPRYSTINTPASNASYGASEISTPRCLSGHPKFLTTQVKYLLNHYRDHVLPFFSVLDNAYTPWRVLHFPKVLQAACETEIAGPPEGPSNVLLYAILTISAYSLQNSEMKRTSLDSSNHWEDTATQYKGQALKLLKIHVGTQSRDRIDSEYEELVAAMLSMVTIDVMCGDTRTCQIHLQACEALIRSQVEVRGRDLSSMSKALHTTFIYLRAMQQAATVNNGEELPEPSWYAGPGERRLDVESILHNHDFTSFIGPTDPKDSSFGSFSSEMIYGFPVQLLLLLRSTIRLINSVRQAASPSGPRGVSNDLASVRDRLEDEIVDWPVEEVVARYKETPHKPGNVEIMEHYTRAFHLALVIFFFHQVHHTRQRLLQQYVGSVIYHLEQIEETKTTHGIVAGPLLWPAFIAASQANDPTIRERFISWLQGSDHVGVGTSNATIRLLNQLWTKAGASNRDGAANAVSQLRLVLT